MMQANDMMKKMKQEKDEKMRRKIEAQIKENMDKNVNFKRFFEVYFEKGKHISSAFVHPIPNTANGVNR